jgi:hypothetical protein
MKIEEIGFNRKPCCDAVEWLEKQPDAQTAWNTCERGDWMWWALRFLAEGADPSWPGRLPSKKISIQFARRCARQAKKYASAYRAAAAADAADYAAHAAAAHAAAAHAAAAHAAAAAAAHAAAAADYAAHHAAYAAHHAAYAADYAVNAAEQKAQADWIRQHIPCPIQIGQGANE